MSPSVLNEIVALVKWSMYCGVIKQLFIHEDEDPVFVCDCLLKRRPLVVIVVVCAHFELLKTLN